MRFVSDRSEVRHPMKEVNFYTDGAIKNLVSRISILDKLKNFTRKVSYLLFLTVFESNIR